MLPAEANQGLGGAERGGGVMPVADKNSLHHTRVNEGRDMARVDRIPNCLLAKPPGSLDLAQIPHRPSKLCRRHYSVVPTEPEPRFPVAGGSKVPERALVMGSRIGEFALRETGRSKDAMGHAGFRCASLRLGLAQEGLGDLAGRTQFGPH